MSISQDANARSFAGSARETVLGSVVAAMRPESEYCPWRECREAASRARIAIWTENTAQLTRTSGRLGSSMETGNLTRVAYGGRFT